MPAGESDYLYRLLTKLGLSDFAAETAHLLIQRPLEILLILIAAKVVSRVGARVASRSVQRLVSRSVRGLVSPQSTTRAETLAGVVASLIRIFVWTVAVLVIIDKLGINLGPLLAGASIVGVAVGFGAQSLVRDFLSGFFVLAEDQFGVGDVITVLDVTGTVEEVNLRITRLRAFDGTVWFVPNGEIRKVGNAAKEWTRAVVDVPIAPSADVTAALTAIRDEVSGISEEEDWAEALLEEPEVLGVETALTEGFTIRVAVKARPGDKARVARELRARIGGRLRRDGLLPREVTERPPGSPPTGVSA
ncbi:MAG: mechanosensitive ion channel family protein [Acidimicrobiales bacterium]|nr:mechanosensitive ion channel family protein [Actinomycetota bacterium]